LKNRLKIGLKAFDWYFKYRCQ